MEIEEENENKSIIFLISALDSLFLVFICPQNPAH